MSSVNVRRVLGGYSTSPENTLRRVVLASMLWEDQFYLDGESHAELVKRLVAVSDPKVVQNLALEARSNFKLRHIPLLLLRELARTNNLPAHVLTAVVQRPDEMGEFVSMYWKDKKEPLSSQVKKGLAACFNKFSEYQLAKHDKNSAAVSVRDVMFLTHPKPKNTDQEALFKRIAEKALATPDTWETKLSSGADKKSTFERLMSEGKLGALAFLRNLRNMRDAGVSTRAINSYAETLDVSKVLPFRYIAAARVVPEYSNMLERLMFKSLAGMQKIYGKTVLLVDVSGSMFDIKVSEKSELDRFDAAAALAVMCRELCDDVVIATFSDKVVAVNGLRGFELVNALRNSQNHSGTQLGKAIHSIKANVPNAERVIVFTDEQSFDVVPSVNNGYMVNVAAYEHSVSNKDGWESITGFSESVLAYIQAVES